MMFVEILMVFFFDEFLIVYFDLEFWECIMCDCEKYKVVDLVDLDGNEVLINKELDKLILFDFFDDFL